MKRKKIVALAAIVVLTASFGAHGADMSFEADPKVQQVAEAYSLDMQDFAKIHFGVVLDGSDASIEQVETMGAKMHESYVKDRPTDDQAMSLAKLFGSYVGEVFRRRHGGTWGWINLNGQRFQGVRTKGGVNFWPWGRAFNRITEGAENNIWHYYQALLEQEA